MLDGQTGKAVAKEPIRVDTNVQPVVVDLALLDRLSPSVRDVAQHAAVLKSVLARLGPIYDLVERETSRMTEVSPFLAGKDQVCHTNIVGSSDILIFTAQVDEARNRLTTEAQKREEKIRAIKDMIEGERRKFVATINGRLEKMIKDIVVHKVKEKVKTQVGFDLETHHKSSLTPF